MNPHFSASSVVTLSSWWIQRWIWRKVGGVNQMCIACFFGIGWFIGCLVFPELGWINRWRWRGVEASALSMVGMMVLLKKFIYIHLIEEMALGENFSFFFFYSWNFYFWLLLIEMIYSSFFLPFLFVLLLFCFVFWVGGWGWGGGGGLGSICSILSLFNQCFLEWQSRNSKLTVDDCNLCWSTIFLLL